MTKNRHFRPKNFRFCENIAKKLITGNAGQRNFFFTGQAGLGKIFTGRRVIASTGRVGSGQKLFNYPRVTGNTGNLVYLVRVGSRVGSHGSGNYPQHP